MAAPFCTACGAAVAGGTRFCVKCGKALAEGPATPVSAAASAGAGPVCAACGAALAAGTRFCVQCGQPVGSAAPPVSLSPDAAETAVFKTPAVPENHVWTPPSPVSPIMPPVVQEVKRGSGAGLWIGIFAILLLLGGAGFWLYTKRDRGVSIAQAGPEPAHPTPQPSVLVAAPTPNATPEVIPQNPDRQPPPAAPRPRVAQSEPEPAPNDPAPPPPIKPERPTSGVLHASVEVTQNGEVVFENLPGERLKFTFDHSLWKPTISHQANGTQTLVMRSLKPGIQTTCDVRWEIIP